MVAVALLWGSRYAVHSLYDIEQAGAEKRERVTRPKRLEAAQSDPVEVEAQRSTAPPRLDPDRAAGIRRLLESRRNEGNDKFAEVEGGGDATSARMPAEPSAIADYLNEVMQHQYLPLFTNCREQLQAENPNVRGELVLDTSLSGASGVGGVVESAHVREGATLDNDEFVLCVQQSLYALVLDAPPEDNMSLPLTMRVHLTPIGGEPPESR